LSIASKNWNQIACILLFIKSRINVEANIWLQFDVITWKWYATLFRKGETTCFFVFNYGEILYLDLYEVSAYNTYSMYQFRLCCNVGLNCRNRYPPPGKNCSKWVSFNRLPASRSKEASTFSHVRRFAAVWAIARAPPRYRAT